MKRILLILITFSSLSFAQYNCGDALEANLGINSCGMIQGELPTVSCVYSNSNTDHANWFRFTSNESMRVILTTDLAANEGQDTRVRVYEGSCSGYVCVAGHDDLGTEGQYGSYLSTVQFDAIANLTYFIVFDDRWSADGFDFEISVSDLPEEPISFTQYTLGSGNNRSCAVDMNGDYLDDVVVVTGSGFRTYFQQEDGTFDAQDFSLSSFYSNSWSIAAADLNGDLKNDLLFGAGNGASLILSHADDDTFDVESSPMYIFSQRTNFVDINNDGLLDAFICHDVEPNVYALNQENTSYDWIQGGLGDFPSGGNYGSIWTDYDNDGDQDLFIAKCRGGSDAKINELHRNNGDGTFTNVAEEANMADPVQTWSSAWGDYDNDGDFDAYVGASYFSDGHHKMMRNNNDGTFTDIADQTMFSEYNGTGIENVAYDFDNNGFIDILADASGGAIFLNQGGLNFETVQINLSGGAVADLNNDGFLDIYKNGTILYNNGNENHWLKIVTVGTESNTNGIGARVELTSNGVTQIREVRSGQGFAHAHTLNTHFGLGENETIDQVVIKWPSGIVDTYTDISIDETHFAIEGETLSTQEFTVNHALKVYPNPVDIYLNLSIHAEIVSAYLYTATGKMTKAHVSNNRISTQQLPNGVYFLKIIDSEGNVYGEKFIVKH